MAIEWAVVDAVSLGRLHFLFLMQPAGPVRCSRALLIRELARVATLAGAIWMQWAALDCTSAGVSLGSTRAVDAVGTDRL